jgi:hypothetical protein
MMLDHQRYNGWSFVQVMASNHCCSVHCVGGKRHYHVELAQVLMPVHWPSMCDNEVSKRRSKTPFKSFFSTSLCHCMMANAATSCFLQSCHSQSMSAKLRFRGSLWKINLRVQSSGKFPSRNTALSSRRFNIFWRQYNVMMVKKWVIFAFWMVIEDVRVHTWWLSFYFQCLGKIHLFQGQKNGIFVNLWCKRRNIVRVVRRFN